MSDSNKISNNLPPWWANYVLAGAVEIVYLIALVMAFMGEDKTLLNVLCTAAVAQAAVAVNFFYQSSAGSAKKDDANASAMGALANSVPVASLPTSKPEEK